MQVNYLDKSVQYENNQDSLDILFRDIEEVVTSNNLIIDRVVIDGYEVYSNFYEFILENLLIIRQIDFHIITATQMLEQMQQTAMQYLERALPELDSLADQFYKEPTQGTWNKFEQLIEGIEWLLQAIKHLTSKSNSTTNKIDLERYQLFLFNLENKVEALGNAVENKDLILIGDYLLYELSPELKGVYNLLQNSMIKEGVVNEHN